MLQTRTNLKLLSTKINKTHHFGTFLTIFFRVSFFFTIFAPLFVYMRLYSRVHD